MSPRRMVAFHRRLADGADPIRELAALGPDDRHPARWAPFVIVLRPG